VIELVGSCLETNVKELLNEKKGKKKSQMIKIQRKGRTMDFETLRFFFIPWKIPENLLFDNG
jgi:hypothetical protein